MTQFTTYRFLDFQRTVPESNPVPAGYVAVADVICEGCTSMGKGLPWM